MLKKQKVKKPGKRKNILNPSFSRVSPLIAFNDEEYELRQERIGLDEQDREYWEGSELGNIYNQSYFKQKIFRRGRGGY
jgi:hypothetical protein|tara:strand:+ start:2440 stop:2676 length:237 start_codon:yes stop_codon:yes gene_type:complete